jgi:hypothetical protein
VFPYIRFPHQNSVGTSPVPYMCHTPRPSYASWFYQPNNILIGVQIIKWLITPSSPLPCYLVPLTTKYLTLHPIHEHPQPVFLPHCRRPSFTPIQKNRQNYSSVYLNLSGDTRWCSWLKHCTKIPKVTGSIPDGVNDTIFPAAL